MSSSRCNKMLDSCIDFFIGPFPLKTEESSSGHALAVAKRIVIGLIATAALAVGLYFLQMATRSIWNPFKISFHVHQAQAITIASLFGLAGLITTLKWGTQRFAG